VTPGPSNSSTRKGPPPDEVATMIPLSLILIFLASVSLVGKVGLVVVGIGSVGGSDVGMSPANMGVGALVSCRVSRVGVSGGGEESGLLVVVVVVVGVSGRGVRFVRMVHSP